MEMYKNEPFWHFENRNEWRAWLTTHVETDTEVWIVIYKKDSRLPSVYYDEAVDEALCFGWIDSKINKRDATSFYQYFCKRNPKSNLSRVNKDKVARLEEQGLMTSWGRACIEWAKATGTWSALDEVEQLILPDEMQRLLQQNKVAQEHWEGFSRLVKRGILERIYNAKTEMTKIKRIN